MKRRSLNLALFLQDFVAILENHQPYFSMPFSIFCHLLHFLQILSYSVKADRLDFSESKFLFLARIIYYANFINLLTLFESNLLTSLIFYALFAILMAKYIFFIAIFVFKRVFGYQSFLKTRLAVSLMRIVVKYIAIFPWILMIPILEFYSNVLDCSAPKAFYSPPQCEDPLIKILSIICHHYGGFLESPIPLGE